MFSSGIRTRLITSFLLLVGITLLVLGSYTLWFFHNSYTKQITEQLVNEAYIADELLRVYMKNDQDKLLIDKLTKELAVRVNHRITVIDKNGVVIADSRENPAVMENHLTRPEVQAALNGEKGIATRYSTTLGENLLYVAVPIKDGKTTLGIVRVAATLIYMETSFNHVRTFLLLAFLLTAALAIMLGIRLAKKYTAPLEKITQIAALMGQGQLDKRIYLRTGDEIEALGQTLNNLAAGLADKITEIEAEKRKLEIILANMDNAVILLDRYGKVVSINKKAACTFGIAPAMLGQHNIQVIGQSILDKAVRETLEQRKPRHIDMKVNLSGVKRIFQVFVAPTVNAENENIGILCVFHDITALKEIEERQVNFVANASHELSTPLTSIKGFAETLLDGAIHDSELSVKFVSIIQEEAERLHRLVKDLMQLARLSSNEYRQQIKLETVQVVDIAENVVNQLYPQWQAKELTLTVESPQTPVFTEANADWLTQVVANIIDNSIKFTPVGGKITVKCTQDDESAVITIEDTGIGIPAADLPLIFDRFYRVDRSRGRQSGGTGLGLSIVKFIIDMLGGSMEVKSTVGVGTVFTITLPSAKQ